MITLFQAAPAYGLPSASPFCIKLELFLKAAGLPYQVKAPRVRSPKGKLPFIEHEGRMIGDSSLIIEYLSEKLGANLDQDLTAQQWATGRLVQRTLEEGYYFCAAYSGWLIDEHWQGYKNQLFAEVPRMLRAPVAAIFRRRMAKSLWSQGIGRHDRATVASMAAQDMRAVAAVLGDNPYLLGDRFTSFDCCVYAFVAREIRAARHAGRTAICDSHQAFVDYCRRIETQYAIAEPLS